jgi:hypothetical protein
MIGAKLPKVSKAYFGRKEEQSKAPLNSCHLIARIASGADISSDVAGARGIEPRSRVLETLILAVELCPYRPVKHILPNRGEYYHLAHAFNCPIMIVLTGVYGYNLDNINKDLYRSKTKGFD